MKKIVIKTERPDAFHLTVTWLKKIFPECEVCIFDSNSNAKDSSPDDVLNDVNGFQNKGADNGKNFNRR